MGGPDGGGMFACRLTKTFSVIQVIAMHLFMYVFSLMNTRSPPVFPVSKPSLVIGRLLCFLENAWNLLKNCEKPGILTQNLENLVLCKFGFSSFTFQYVIFKKV